MRLVLITPPVTRTNEHATLQRLFQAGLETLHLRKPGAGEEEVASYVGALPTHRRLSVVLHSHHALARRASVKGIHLSEADRPEGGIITAPPGLTVSTAFHHLHQLGVCMGEVDYVLLSPIFDSISKQGYAAAFADRAELASCLATSRYPVLALGGVTPARLAEVAELGFAGAALLGGVWGAPDPVEAWLAARREAERLAGE